MKKILFSLLILLSVSFPVMADVLNVDGLSKEEVARLTIQAEQMKSSSIQGESIKEVDKWVELGDRVGRMIGSGVREAAKELNLAVNEFAETPVGKITIVLIVWKVIGNDLVHLFVGIIWFAVMIPGWIYFFRRTFYIDSIEKYSGRDDGLRKKIKYNDIPESFRENEMLTGMFYISLFFIVLIGFVTIFTM